MSQGEFILIVEDCEEAVPALQIALESFFGCDVRHAPEVNSALEELIRSPDSPIAIITDLNLPGKDGLELIRQLRASRRWQQLPIVVVSADPHPQTPVRAMASGADAFFAKPYSPLGLCHSLEKIIHAKHQMLAADADSGGPVGAKRG